jgi:uncharacterized protein YukE
MPVPANDNKLQELIQKFGGFAGIALISLTAFMYQADRASTKNEIAGLEKNIAANQRAIGRLQEGKVSREEFKNVQEQWIRETQGLRQDLRDLANALRIDVKGSMKQ